MKIKLEIEMPIEIVGNYVVIKSQETMNQLFGIVLPLGVNEFEDNYSIPLSRFKEIYKEKSFELNHILGKIKDLQQKTSIMKQILEGRDIDNIKQSKPIKKWFDAENNIKPKSNNFGQEWTEKELDILKKNIKLTSKQLKVILPNRSIKSISIKKWKVGVDIENIENRNIPSPWSQKDCEVILNNLDKTNQELVDLLSEKRTYTSVAMKKCQLMKANNIKVDPNVRKKSLEARSLSTTTLSSNKAWSRGELQTLKNNPKATYKELMQYLPGRSKIAVKQARYKLKHNAKLFENLMKNSVDVTDSVEHNEEVIKKAKEIEQTEKLDFWNDIDKKAKELSEEIENSEKEISNTIMVDEISKFNKKEISYSMIDLSKMKLLDATVRHNLIGKKVLSFRDVAWIPTTYENKKWNIDIWNQFIDEFMYQSDMIAEFYGVKNTFVVNNDDDMKKIKIFEE